MEKFKIDENEILDLEEEVELKKNGKGVTESINLELFLKNLILEDLFSALKEKELEHNAENTYGKPNDTKIKPFLPPPGPPHFLDIRRASLLKGLGINNIDINEVDLEDLDDINKNEENASEVDLEPFDVENHVPESTTPSMKQNEIQKDSYKRLVSSVEHIDITYRHRAKLNCVSLQNKFDEQFLMNNIHLFENGSIICRFLQKYDYHLSRFLCNCISPDNSSMNAINRSFLKCHICYAKGLEIQRAIFHCHCVQSFTKHDFLRKLAYKPYQKWWKQRQILFSKFDQGIIIESDESWYSVIPEKIAQSISKNFIENYKHIGSKSVILDGFCGVGGSAIQFAKIFKVIAIDIDPIKIEVARHNAGIYNVDQNIEFIVGDFFQVAPTLQKIDVVFLAPPWGGPNYKKLPAYDLETNMPNNGKKIFSVASSISNNIAFYVPKNTKRDQLININQDSKPESVDQNLFQVIRIQENRKRRVADKKWSGITALTAYYGPR